MASGTEGGREGEKKGVREGKVGGREAESMWEGKTGRRPVQPHSGLNK